MDITAGPLTDALIVLAGPRRVGKSVILMDSVDALCRRPDIDPRQIIHIPCDELAARDLRRVVTLGRELTRSVDPEQIQGRIWLFDEITQITGWTATLKTARDGTPFGDDTVVATGSRWVKGANAAANLFAGRAGLEDTRRLRHVASMLMRHRNRSHGSSASLSSAVRARWTSPPLPRPSVIPTGPPSTGVSTDSWRRSPHSDVHNAATMATSSSAVGPRCT